MALQLEYIQLVHRHGERTPLLFGEHDKTNWNLCHRTSSIGYTAPVENSTSFLARVKEMVFGCAALAPIQFRLSLESGRNFNCAPGQLTDKGRETLITLGKWFRRKYIEEEGLASPIFKKQEFLLRSTNFQRTLESLQSLMQGMFPVHPAVMDVKVNDLTGDPLSSERRCPRLKKMLMDSRERIKKEFAPKIQRISKYFSEKFSPGLAALSPYAIYELISASNAHGYTKFRSVPKKVLDDLEEYSVRLWFDHLKNTDGLALNTGCLLKEMSNQLLMRIADPDYPARVSIFSAHDITIYPLLMAMGLHTKKWPKFGSNVIFELLKDTDSEERYVRMRYNGVLTPIPKCTQKKDKHTYCSLEEFVNICNAVHKENFAEECLKDI